MSTFIKDLTDEGSTDIKHTLVRCKKEEPLTVWYAHIVRRKLRNGF